MLRGLPRQETAIKIDDDVVKQNEDLCDHRNKIITENVESSSLDRYFSFQGNPKDINFLDELLDYKKDILQEVHMRWNDEDFRWMQSRSYVISFSDIQFSDRLFVSYTFLWPSSRTSCSWIKARNEIRSCILAASY